MLSLKTGTTKLCLDVQYSDSVAVVGAVEFIEWTDALPLREFKLTIPTPSDYEPGAFYKRELPCLLAVIEQLAELPKVIIVDGYVWLGPEQPGLGAHLYEALERKVVIVGIAKNYFRSEHGAQKVVRGESTRPLFVTAAGMEAEAAALAVLSMAGDYRIPTLVKRADQIARDHDREKAG